MISHSNQSRDIALKVHIFLHHTCVKALPLRALGILLSHILILLIAEPSMFIFQHLTDRLASQIQEADDMT